MNYETARKLVIADQRESWAPDEMTDEEIIAEVEGSISTQSPAPIGAVTLEDYGDELSRAYRVVVEAFEKRVS